MTEIGQMPADPVAIDAWLRDAIAKTPGGSAACAWGDRESATITEGALDDSAFGQRLAVASRYTPRGPLAPSEAALAEAKRLLDGWNPERWTTLDAQRVRLVVARAEASADSLPEALEQAFRYADEGELCALYRSLQFLPDPQAFTWRAGEGCRTNMRTVFEACALDSAYPSSALGDVAWRQLVIKCLFIESPLWRCSGLDARVDDELARMALDLVEERRSAGRRIQPELWLCLGATSDPRGLPALEAELAGQDELGRKAAVLALGRLGATDRLEEIRREGGSVLGPVAESALMGRHDQAAFRAVSPADGAHPSTTTADA